MGVGPMHLARFPRRRYTAGETPIERLPRFSEAVGGPDIYIKRDDLLGLTGGGNKTRKLEFLVADALAKGADTLITCGGIQSNHCRLTLSAAVKEGMHCWLVLTEAEPGAYRPDANGNIFLFQLLGAERIKLVGDGVDTWAELSAAAAEATAAGRRPYIIPMGGSNAVGALGYVACAEKLMGQCFETGLRLDHVVLAGGSAGTLAGLWLGFGGNRLDVPLTAISVLNPKEKLRDEAREIARAAADRLGAAAAVDEELLTCRDEYIGPGYAQPTPEMIEAVRLLARTEGVLLDPIYTGKAMAGLIDLAHQGVFRPGENVLFLHTGGVPGLYALTGLFTGS